MDDKTNNIFENQIKPSNDFRRLLPKLIFLILSVVILVEAVIMVRAFQATPPKYEPQQVRPITGGQIALVADNKTPKVGDEILVQARIDTGGRITNGTDLIIKYDNTAFEASQSSLITGKIYPEYPLSEVSQTDGSIRISGISSSTKTFNGVGLLASFTLKAKKAGNFSVSVEHKKGNTTDSNIITTKDAEDILENVTNLNLSVK